MSVLFDVDVEGNCGSGDILFVDICNIFVQSDGCLVVMVGVDDLVVVDIFDVLLIVCVDWVQEVCRVVQWLKDEWYEVYWLYWIVNCFWGSYIVFEEGLCFKIK